MAASRQIVHGLVPNVPTGIVKYFSQSESSKHTLFVSERNNTMNESRFLRQKCIHVC